MSHLRISKRVVDSIEPTGKEFTVWDTDIPGFGVRVRPSGARSYVFVFRAGHGRKAPVRRHTLGEVSRFTPEEARALARQSLSAAAQGLDPAGKKAEERAALTLKELAETFIEQHTKTKRKNSTASDYERILRLHVLPELGSAKANRLTRTAVSTIHLRLKGSPAVANKMLAVISSMYGFAQRHGLVPDGFNPATKIEKYPEVQRERFLTAKELSSLGDALLEAETDGLPWDIDASKPVSKHLARPENQKTKFDPLAVAALRLLLLTGCRLREILHLQWEHVDFERGMLFLPDSKTGKKAVILNEAALSVLAGLPKSGTYVVPGEDVARPRHDLKRLWAAVSSRAGLDSVRIHDLRHTFASIGAGIGLGLPIVGRLLGHKQAATTSRYAHLDNDPVRRATQQIGQSINAALNSKRKREIGAP
ncbi:tyrosine-type recombinase/integrase [Bradyrhizobium sp. 956_D2_N1_5]|uniref:tyrosine-type recombinase/integrase n=1 Tax=unclassified Bradyrhizobium TaxID=2631580 RepID=UPI003F26F30B